MGLFHSLALLKMGKKIALPLKHVKDENNFTFFSKSSSTKFSIRGCICVCQLTSVVCQGL